MTKTTRTLLAYLVVLGLFSAAGVWGAAITESPTGQSNVEVLAARDQNALPTPKSNYQDELANNAAGISVPTPASGHCIRGDTATSTSTDDFAYLCSGGLTVQQLKLKPGSATAGTAPLKFTAGTLLTAVEAGAMEFWNNAFWLTNLAVRRTVVQAQGILVSTQTVANTTTETTIYTQNHGANYLVVGKSEDILLNATLTSNFGAGANILTIRAKYAGTTLGTWVVPEANRSLLDVEIHVVSTVRAIGAGSTSIQVRGKADLEGTAIDPVVNILATGLDSTTVQATTITVEWSDASVGNSLQVLQGRALSIDNNS